MTEWTEAEVEKVAERLYGAALAEGGRYIPWIEADDETKNAARRISSAILSAVKRVPVGFWLAPLELDDTSARAGCAVLGNTLPTNIQRFRDAFRAVRYEWLGRKK